jgi:tetratricopeptide (TPR) repeat protein
MRAIGLALAFLGLATAAQAANPPLANPPGCDDFGSNTTGVASADCDAAIAAETDPQAKSVLLYRRAYIIDAARQASRYDSAIADLSEAVRLYPRNWVAWHERGYLYNEMGWPDKAESDLDAQAQFTPQEPTVYEERALARFMRGNLQGAFEDRDADVRLSPGDPGALDARARALMWLGRFDAARQDADAASALAQKSGDKNALDFAAYVQESLKRWTMAGDSALAKQTCDGAMSEAAFVAPTFIGDCTRAFLDAKTGKERADALSQRASADELVEQRSSAGMDDFRLAIAFDPDNPERQFNLGSLLQNIGRYREGLRYLDLSLAAKPDAYGFAARAGAKYGLEDYDGAFADAKKSFEMKPNELALTVLGDIDYTQRKDMKSAKLYWMGTYHLGDRDDGLIARLKKVGVDNPDAEPRP